jgi:hypothetical protein
MGVPFRLPAAGDLSEAASDLSGTASDLSAKARLM